MFTSKTFGVLPVDLAFVGPKFLSIYLLNEVLFKNFIDEHFRIPVLASAFGGRPLLLQRGKIPFFICLLAICYSVG